jgi:hypothetical protein
VVSGPPDVLDDCAADLGCDRAVVLAGERGELGANRGLDMGVNLDPAGSGVLLDKAIQSTQL